MRAGKGAKSPGNSCGETGLDYITFTKAGGLDFVHGRLNRPVCLPDGINAARSKTQNAA